MKRLIFLGAIALAALCISCKKDENKESDYYKDVPELREEFDNLAQHLDGSGGLSGYSYFDATDQGCALTIEFYDVALGSSNNNIEGYFSIPFENVAPEKRILPYRYYKFTPNEFSSGLASFKTYGQETKLRYVILRIDPEATELHFDFIAVTTNNENYEYKIKANLKFPAKTVHVKSPFTFKSTEATASAVYRHKPISNKNFDVLSVTFKTTEGTYPCYFTTLHFVVNHAANLQAALSNLPGKYYGITPTAEDFGDHKLYGFHFIDDQAGGFYGENEWGETIVSEFVNPSTSQYLQISPIYGDGTKFDISGTVSRYLYLVGSEENYNLNIASTTVNIADITEE